MNETDNNAEDKIEFLRGVRQVRQFTDQEVPEDVMHDILEVGRWSGSGMNKQPWEFLLVRNQESLKQIAAEEAANSHLAGAKFAIVVVMPEDSQGINTYDEGRLTERLLLAAAAHGVGAGVWWFKDGGAAARHILSIPEDRKLRTAVSFGYPSAAELAKRQTRQQGRKPLSELVHEEKY